MGKRKKRSQGRGRALLRGVAAGTGFLLLAVMLLALAIYLGWLPESAIPIGNTVIKILTALVSGFASGMSKVRVPWYFGGIAAALTLTVSIAIMSVYLGSFQASWSLLADYLMSFSIGAAAAAVLSRRNAQ